MEKLKYLYWQLFVVWLKENNDTFPSLAVCALTYYFSRCFQHGCCLFGPCIVNIIVPACLVGVVCFDLLCVLWSKLIGEEGPPDDD